MEEYIGVIKLFAGNFAPRSYMLCLGQLLPIAQNSALFAILGTTYGGDGITTFALPNLQGAVPIGQGTQAGTNYALGQVGGTQNVTLTTNNLPAHQHNGMGTISVSNSDSTDSVAIEGAAISTPGTTVARAFSGTLGYSTTTPTVNLISNVKTASTGNNIPVSLMQPYVAMNYIICVAGVYPTRN